MPRRVVITGVGGISPIGLDVPSSLASLREGRHGIRKMPEWDFMTDLQGRLGGTVEGIDLEARYSRRVRRTMGRVALLSLVATEEALAQAKLEPELLRSGRVGVAYGSTSGSSSALEAYSRPLMFDNTMRGLESNAYLRIMTHTCAANLASHFRLKGRLASTCSACTSGSQAIGAGYELVRAGLQDVVLAGGAEEMHYTTAVTFDLLMATSVRYNDRPDESPRPFDAARDGLVVGEGAGTLVLEALEHAEARGATILGEVLGYASNCDGGHMVQPDPDGMRRVMELALADAGLTPDDIGYVNAHATGTQVGDEAEARATGGLFGARVPVSSLKGHVGHTLGACGALEAIWTLGMMREGFLAPTRNLGVVDPACRVVDHVTSVREARVTRALSNNFAFGGVNTSIVLGLVD